jgi:hypothetical protein
LLKINIYATYTCSGIKIIMCEEISDAFLEAQLEELKVGDSKLLCPKGHKVAHLRTNPECKEALMCAEPDCATYEAHGGCPMMSLRAQQNVERKGQRLSRFRSADAADLERPRRRDPTKSKKADNVVS